jgi:hypothetical protein
MAYQVKSCYGGIGSAGIGLMIFPAGVSGE